MPNHSPALLDDLRARFLAALRSTFSKKEPQGLYAPVNYILDLGGKRVRPLVALLAGKMFGDDDLQQAMPVALAVEVFHNFTLLHDDIMDDSPLRRGQATVHEKWDVNTGILSGDLMLIQAYQHLCDCPNTAALPDLLATFNRVATGVCEGQQYDVDFEQRADVTIAEYTKMIELKTAVLLGGALELGALAAGAEKVDAQHLYAFGRLTGLAFQLQDDLLDTFGDEKITGKRTGNDIIRNKKTPRTPQRSRSHRAPPMVLHQPRGPHGKSPPRNRHDAKRRHSPSRRRATRPIPSRSLFSSGCRWW